MSEPKPTDYYQGQSVSDFIALFALPWHLANVVKYIVRWWLKDDMAGLYKAKDYLDTFIGNCEADPTFKASTVAGIKATIEARRVAEVKPVDAAPAEPESDFDSLKPGDFFATCTGPAFKVLDLDRVGRFLLYDFSGNQYKFNEHDYVKYGYRKVAKS